MIAGGDHADDDLAEIRQRLRVGGVVGANAVMRVGPGLTLIMFG